LRPRYSTGTVAGHAVHSRASPAAPHVPAPRRPRPRDRASRLASATRGLPAVDPATQPSSARPPPLDLALPALVPLARGARHREAGDGDRLATPEVPRVLGQALRPTGARSPAGPAGDPRPHPPDVVGQRHLGITTNRLRTSHGRHRGREVDGREVHGEAAEAGCPDLARVLADHVSCLASTDFFTVPTVRNRVLDVFVVLAHLRRRVLHFNVTTNPTTEWTSRQITEASPWDTAPPNMIRDRDGIYADIFRGRVKSVGIQEVLIAPRSPWQSPFIERLIGSIRRDCLDHVVVRRAPLAVRSDLVPRLLPRLPLPHVPGRRRAGAPRTASAEDGQGDRVPRGRRTSSPLRAASVLIAGPRPRGHREARPVGYDGRGAPGPAVDARSTTRPPRQRPSTPAE
jgi:hypothetical protein